MLLQHNRMPGLHWLAERGQANDGNAMNFQGQVVMEGNTN
jgi:hypothetical protein